MKTARCVRGATGLRKPQVKFQCMNFPELVCSDEPPSSEILWRWLELDGIGTKFKGHLCPEVVSR